MKTVRVRTLWDLGFKVGPEPDRECVPCRHVWGDHLLAASMGNPLDGGLWSCPDCACSGTWAVPVLREFVAGSDP